MKVVDGESQTDCPKTPLSKEMKVSKKYMEKIVGIKLTDDKVFEALKKMGLSSKKSDKED